MPDCGRCIQKDMAGLCQNEMLACIIKQFGMVLIFQVADVL